MTSSLNVNREIEPTKWRDISPEDLSMERKLKISVAALATIVLLGGIIGAYFCFTTHMATYNAAHEIIYLSNGPMASIPLSFGTIVPTLLFSVVYFINFEKNHSYDKLKTEEEKKEQFNVIKQSSFEKLLANGGVGPLVRSGVLTVAEGVTLSELMQTYGSQLAVKKRYERMPNLKKVLEQRPTNIEEYDQAITSLEEGQWKLQVFQESLGAQYVNQINKAQDPAKWRDITSKDRQSEKRVKIGLTALGVIILIGTIIGVCFCLTTTRGIFDRKLLTVVQYSNAPFSALFVFALLPLVGTFLQAACTNFEKNNKDWAESELKREEVRQDRLQLIKEKPFSEVHSFLSARGGLGPLVRNKLLTIEQGEQMQKLTQRYERSLAIQRSRAAAPSSVERATAELANIESEWKEFQKQWTAIPLTEKTLYPALSESTQQPSTVIADGVGPSGSLINFGPGSMEID